MHIHQQNHWNDISFYWYQSYHWYQWTIGLTNRIRLCTLDMCGGEKTPPSQSEPAYQVSYFIISNTNLKITRTLCVKTVSLFHKEQTFHVSVDPDANQLCQVQFTMKFKKVEMNSIPYILCKSFLEAKCMLTMSSMFKGSKRNVRNARKVTDCFKFHNYKQTLPK